MALLSSGEITIVTETRRIALRLSIKTTQQLEEYFGMSILDILLEKFNTKAPLTDELMVVYAGMTGRDINDGNELIKACNEMMDVAGISSTIVGVKECLWATNAPRAASMAGQNLDQSLGKLQAVQTVQQHLGRKTISWAQQQMKRACMKA